MVIFDEAHHLTDRCINCLQSYNINRVILLSATINRDMKYKMDRIFSPKHIKVTIKEAIDKDVLPDPTIYLLPLYFDTNKVKEQIIINKTKNKVQHISYKNRFIAYKDKQTKYIVNCTESEYYEHISSLIEWSKNQYMKTKNEGLKNIWLRKCLDRLVWMSNIKMYHTMQILNYLKKHNCRTLTFCSSIEQSYHIFNNGYIDHITAVNCLNEGVNLKNCQIGIFNVINSSDIMTIQKVGRILRHKNPIIIIPFYKNSREEEILLKMLEPYNKDLIKTITYYGDIKI
jgi:superfamily II DNA or RNA helicase